jgi:hypothetical protein
MAITAVVVSATLNTTGDTAFTSSGFGTPDAAIILIGRGNTTNNPGTHATFTGGFWCSDPGQAGITFCSEDAQGTTDTRRYGDSTYAGNIASPTADSVGISYSASATTDGINLSVAAGSTTLNRYASVILLKGLTNAHVGSVNLGTGTSAINVTAPGFRADLVLLLSTWAADATVTPSARGSFGAGQISAGGTVAQGCISYESTDNAGASTASTIVLNDKALARITSRALAVECAIGANDNGFSITPSADSGSQYAYYLAIECPDPEDAYVGVVDTITGTGDQAYTGAGLTPQALVLASTLATAVDTVTDSGAFNMGFGGPTTSEWSSVYIDEYNSDPTDTEGYVDASNILHIRSAVGTEDTVAALTTFGADGWTLNYSNGSGTARKVLAIAIGNSSTPIIVAPGAGGIAVAGQAPTISQPHTVAPAAGAVSVAGYAPSLAQGVSVAPGVGSVAYTGQSPVILQPHTVTPSAGAVTVLGYAPAIQQAAGIYPGAGEVVYAGQAPTIRQPHTVAPGVGAYDILGYAPTVSQAAGVAPLAGSIIILGYAPSIAQPHTVAPGAGAAAWLGYEPTISQIASSFTEAQLQEILAYVEANMTVPTANEIATAVWQMVLEGALTAEQIMRIKLAALAGKRQGLGTATEAYLAQDGVTPRVTFTPSDASGNGTTVVDGS